METHKLNYAYPACPPVWYCAPYSGRKDEQIKFLILSKTLLLHSQRSLKYNTADFLVTLM